MKFSIQYSSARLIVYLLLANAAVSTLGFGFLYLLYQMDGDRFLGSILFIPIFGSFLLALRRGYVTFTKWTVVTLNFALILLQVWIDGGIKSPDFFTLLIAIILATLVFGVRGTIVTTSLSLAAGYAFTFLQTSPHVYSKQEMMVIQFSTFVTIAFYFYFSIKMQQDELNRNVHLNEQLTTSESRMRDLIVNLPLSAMVVRYSGEIDMVNERFTQMLGYTIDDLKSMKDGFDFFYLDSKQALEQSNFWKEHALTQGNRLVSSETDIYTKDRKRVDVEVHASFLGEDVVVLLNDVTRRKEAEKALAIQQTQLLVVEQKRRSTLETIESISLDLRKAEHKSDFYEILLEKCIDLLGATSGYIYEPFDGHFVLSMSRAEESSRLETEASQTIEASLSEFSRSSQIVSMNPSETTNQPVVLVKLLSEERILGFLVLLWPLGYIADIDQTILQTLAEISGIALDRMRVLETLEERVKTRTREIRVLYEIMQLYVSNEDIQDVISESLKIILNTIHADASAFFLAESGDGQYRLISCLGCEDGIIREGQVLHLADYGWKVVLESGIPIVLDSPLYPFSRQNNPNPSAAESFIGVPVRTETGLLAVIAFYYLHEIDLSLDDLNLINLLSDQIGMVIERNVLRQQLKNAAVIEERQRLSRELHDSLTQSLYSLKLISDAGIRMAKQQKWEEVQDQLNTIFEISMQALKEMRLLVYELVPEAIEQQGLVTALEQRLNFVEKRSGMTVGFSHQGTLELSKDIQMNLYRIAQEALNNAAKHAFASKIQVSLKEENRALEMCISDNGKGFDSSSSSSGMGLKNMQDRTAQLGGQFKVDSTPDQGTVITVSIDL